FFFSSRRRHTRSKRDWSSDVCSSDLFKLQTIDGEQVKLSDYRGEKVILNFWATWCPPCRAEMPDMQKFHADHDATILAVNLTERSEERRVGKECNWRM